MIRELAAFYWGVDFGIIAFLIFDLLLSEL